MQRGLANSMQGMLYGWGSKTMNVAGGGGINTPQQPKTSRYCADSRLVPPTASCQN
jgi:hypothetical protein